VVKHGIWSACTGQRVLSEGDAGDFFCIVIEGEMRVTKNKKLLTCSRGRVLREMAYLSLSARRAAPP